MEKFNSQKNSDNISELPIDKIQPSGDELEIVNTLFKNHNKTMMNIFNEIKDTLLIGLLFIVFTLPQLDVLLNKFIPITQTSVYILTIIKMTMVMILYWIIKYFYLSRK
jgi:hypothetical protein